MITLSKAAHTSLMDGKKAQWLPHFARNAIWENFICQQKINTQYNQLYLLTTTTLLLDLFINISQYETNIS